MSALSRGQGGRGDAPSPRGSFGFADRLVLPRFLRKPARLASRVSFGDMTIPRHASLIASAALIGAATLYGAILGGHMPDVVSAVTARAGFAVEEVRISGHKETSEIDILERLGLDGWTSMIVLDAAEARRSIAGLPWVESAEIRKVYPGTIEVALVERKPFAIWQQGRDLQLIEADGSVIAPFRGEKYAALPLLLGSGAPALASDFIERVAAHPALASRVKGYIRVGERRWDLRLENGVTIRLPEIGEDEAIAEVLRLDAEQALLSRDIEAVDLRLEGKLVIRLTPEAALRRNAALEQAQKSRKAEKRT